MVRFGAPRHQIEATVAWGVENARIVFLVEEGERWPVGAAEHIMSLPHLARGMLVVGRPTELWRHLDQVDIAWDTERLHKIMDRWGSDAWFAQLDAWSREGSLMRRPWEYAAIARLTKLERVTHPVQVLQLLLKPIADARNEDTQQTGKNRQELRRRAWHATLDGQDLWQAKETTAGIRWGLDKRLLVDTGEGYRFAHSLWQSYFAAEYATKRAPVSVAAQLVGVRDWQQVIAWALALGNTRWAGRLLEAIAGELSRTWRGSGWLQGAEAVGDALHVLGGYESARQVRVQMEQVLLALLPPEAEFEAVDKALLALAPLSQDTVEHLWRKIFFCRWHDGYFTLAEEPGIARRLLALEKPTREDDVYLLWRIARFPNVDLEQLVAAGERWFDGGGNARRWRVSAVSGALCIQGTDAAAWRLVTWLEQEAQIDADADFAYKLRKNLEEGLRLWVGSKRTLAKNMATLFREEIPDWIWRPVLNAMLRDRDAARPILQERLDDPNVSLLPDQRYYLDSEVNFWSDDSPRFSVSTVTDLTSPWCLTEPRPWEVAASFFEQLATGDGHLWYVMDWIVRQDEVKVWAGEEHKYAQGLRTFALDGTPPQQAAALTWLARMPANFGRGAFNRGELAELLDAEWVVSRAALDYFVAHRREDVLDKVKAMCVCATIEGREVEKQICAGGWSEALMYRREEIATWQRDLAAALNAFESGGRWLVWMALENGVPSRHLISPAGQARYVLIHSVQHFETLVQAVVEERAPEWWLTAAIAAHSVILEEADGEFIVREGEKRFLLREWITNARRTLPPA